MANRGAGPQEGWGGMKPLTHTLRESLAPVATEDTVKRRSQKTGIDLPDAFGAVLEEVTQIPAKSGDKNSERLYTSQAHNPHVKETHMNQNTNQNFAQNNNGTEGTVQQPAPIPAPQQHIVPNGFDQQAFALANAFLQQGAAINQAVAKMAHEGVTVGGTVKLKQPEVAKRRDATGAMVIGGVVGGVVGGTAATCAMAFIPATVSNTDMVYAGGAGFAVGASLGVSVGYLVGSREPAKKDKKSEE